MPFDNDLVWVDARANLTGVDLVNIVIAEVSTDKDQLALQPLFEAIQMDVLR